jgi:hypothetical protein
LRLHGPRPDFVVNDKGAGRGNGHCLGSGTLRRKQTANDYEVKRRFKVFRDFYGGRHPSRDDCQYNHVAAKAGARERSRKFNSAAA